VVVHRFDRLSRNLIDAVSILKDLRERGIPLTIVTEPELGITAEHTFVFNLLSAFAEFERELIRDCLAEGRAALKRRGRRVAGIVPYGYRAHPQTRQLMVDRWEADRVRKMFAWAASGRTPQEIAATANERDWRTKTRTSKTGRVTGGGVWIARQVLATLSNPVYVGRIRDSGQTCPGVHTAVVNQDLFDQVRETIEGRRTRRPGRANSAFPWPLRGILKCGRCERPMSPNTSGYRDVRYRYYRCRSTAGGVPACQGVRVPAEEIEVFVIKSLGEAEWTVPDPVGAGEDYELSRTFRVAWNALTERPRRDLLPRLESEVVLNPDASTISTTIETAKLATFSLESGDLASFEP